MHWYEDDAFWSDFSETMFSERRRAETAELVARSRLLDFPAGARVLDLCCGPGPYLVPLAQRGCAVTGVDLSPAMLERARAACARAGIDARLVRADMLEHVEPGSYDVVLNVFTSFGYFDDPRANLQVLRNAHDSLVPGGRLLIDVMGKEVLAGWIGRPQLVELDGGVYHAMVDVALGRRPALLDAPAPTGPATAFVLVYPDRPGTLTGWTGLDSLANFPGNPEWYPTAAPGDRMRHLTDQRGCTGIVLAEADTAELAQHRALAAAGSVRPLIITDDTQE